MTRNCLFSLMGALFLSGCGLVGPITYSSSLPDELYWKHDRTEPRLPKNRLEELAVRVAAERQTVIYDEKTIIYVAEDQKEAIVAVIENISDDDNSGEDLFSPKKVERYLIRSGRILASMGPTIEPFPDAPFERAVLTVAKNAVNGQGWDIMVVMDWSQRVTLKALARGCEVEITCYKTEDGGPGELIFRKMANGCKPDWTH